ncbi:MAG TPA: WxL domain-containing protein [Ktedonobacteraceae bacterium]|nr:WxL domain-containing protein [Ktedonobacteraceae bacterium]
MKCYSCGSRRLALAPTILLGVTLALVLVFTSAFTFVTAPTTVVNATNMQGWTFINDQTNSTTTATGQMVAGPTGQPSGIGSAQLTTSGPTDGQALALYNPSKYAGVKLSAITSLNYWTYQSASNPSSVTAIALQFDIDLNTSASTHPYQGRMIYEPYRNIANVPVGTWSQWDAINGGSGVWWLSKASTLTGGQCSQNTPCTWSQIITNYPNAGIWTDGGIVFKAGSGWSGAFSGNVDDFTIGVSGNNAVYDFESPCTSTCGTSNTTATATVVAGTLSETADSSATATAVTLSGANQSTSYSFHINVVDARGTGAGWNLTMQTSQFQTAGNTHQLSTTASTLNTVSAACVASTTCSASGGTAQTPGSDLSTAAKIWSANSTGEGMGSWTVTPTVNVAIPANTYAGTYTSNVTVDLIAGP